MAESVKANRIPPKARARAGPLAAAGVMVILSMASPVWAGSEAPDGGPDGLDTVWVLLGAMLVFFMQAGFGMVEAGFIRAKNACNILTKNFLDYCTASIMFFLVGYAFMFGDGNGFIGWSNFGMAGFAIGDVAPHTTVSVWAFWFFQAAFCGAAATIVAGGMAERMKFPAYLIYTVVISALVYPIIGHWVWGGGWLAGLETPFVDFAGSSVVHATGGWAAFIGALLLGPRIGKYNGDGKARAIAGHSIPLASLGVFILWFGWFGFNPGSTLGVTGQESTIALVAINTNLAAAAGAVVAMLTVWCLYGKPDLSMTMNGALAGLVAVTAPCGFVAPWAAIAIGAVGGVIVVLGVALMDKIRVDDPVGAVPVHGMNGIWGTLALGIFGHKELGLTRNGLLHGGGFAQLGVQVLGIGSLVIFVMAVMTVVFKLIDHFVGLRVSREEEFKGLDITQHGMESYAGFQVFTTQ